MTRKAAAALLDAAGVVACARVLDVATGTGALAEAAAERGAHVTAVDITPEMLDVVRERLPNAELVQADAEDLPFGDASFDAVVAGFVLNHLPVPERGLGEWARVLRPSGRVAVALWERAPSSRLSTLLGEATSAAGLDPGAGIPPGPDPFRLADEGALSAALSTAGFEAPEEKTLALEHEAPDAGSLYEGLLGGTVRGGTAVLAQDEAGRERVRAEFEQIAETFRDGDRLRIPAAARMASARRGSA